jgi:hypothetical protein
LTRHALSLAQQTGLPASSADDTRTIRCRGLLSHSRRASLPATRAIPSATRPVNVSRKASSRMMPARLIQADEIANLSFPDRQSSLCRRLRLKVLRYYAKRRGMATMNCSFLPGAAARLPKTIVPTKPERAQAFRMRALRKSSVSGEIHRRERGGENENGVVPGCYGTRILPMAPTGFQFCHVCNAAPPITDGALPCLVFL